MFEDSSGLELSLLPVLEIVVTWEGTIPALTKKLVDSGISRMIVVIWVNSVVTPSRDRVVVVPGAFK